MRPVGTPVACAIAVVVALWSGWVASHVAHPGFVSDMDQVWFAARALLAGRDPYALIGPGLEFEWRWPFYYPLSAATLVLPLAPFPVVVTRIVVGAGAGGLLAYVIARRQPVALLLFVSKTYYVNLWYVQWSVLLTLALFLPAAGAFFAGKPTLGAATLAGFRDRRSAQIAVLAALVPLGVSFLLAPSWVPRWLSVLRDGEHLRPFITLPGGFLLVLAALRWRHWEARLLLALALVPQTMLQYGALPLLLIPRSIWSQALLVACTYLPAFLIVRAPFAAMNDTDFVRGTELVGMLTLWSVYLPALALVLWPRPSADNSEKEAARS